MHIAHRPRVRTASAVAVVEARVVVWVGLLLSALVLILSPGAAWLPAT